MNNIGEYIKNTREAKRYSQRKLGYMSKVCNTTINRIENGTVFPTPITLRKLASPLGVRYEELLNIAEYLEKKTFVPSNINLVREKHKVTCAELAEGIKAATGEEITPEVLEFLEEGNGENPPYSYVDAIAKYEGVNPDFFFRENTSDDLEYAVKNDPYKSEELQNKNCLEHLEDRGLKEWVTDLVNVDYIVFAKKVFDLGIDPEYVYQEFVTKVFRKKK